ncbi:MAG: TetR/AcrR family transcriptional regulator, partial [Actinomycetota bacterium]|nr:TetR/AcrR family transcriptional regulator [Actinomycetota bacterium]
MPGSKAPEEQRREELLDAAFRVAARTGLGSLTAAEVAREAGLSKGLVFFHFVSKDGLLLALLDRLVSWALDVPSPDRTPAARLLAGLAGEAGFNEEDRARVDLLLQYVVLAARAPELRDRAAEGLQHYREALRQPAEDLLRHTPAAPGPTAPDPAATAPGLAALATAVVIGSAVQAFLDDRFSPADVVDGLRALVALPEIPG